MEVSIDCVITSTDNHKKTKRTTCTRVTLAYCLILRKVRKAAGR